MIIVRDDLMGGTKMVCMPFIEEDGIDEYVVLNNHDGELLPDLNVRMQVIREIRKWNADVVFGLRPNDYHPDHRNAGKLVEESAVCFSGSASAKSHRNCLPTSALAP